MRRVFCDFNSMNDENIEISEALERLKAHYIYHHLVNENNYHFKQFAR